MGVFKTLIIGCIFCSLTLFSDLPFEKRKILYLIQKEKFDEALDRYLQMYEKEGHDFEILQNMCYLFLEKGVKADDQEIRRLTMYGAGISGSSQALKILEEGFYGFDPEVQMLALHLLSFYHEDRTQKILNEAMSSDFLAIRMEALYQMAEKKHPATIGHIESLMNRIPPQGRYYFPHLYAMIATPEAINYLKRFLFDDMLNVRVEAILGAMHFSRDELLPSIRRKIGVTNTSELEAVIMALGHFQDSSSIEKIKRHTLSPSENIQLAAYYTLYHLGEPSAKKFIEKKAKEKNIFAITLLSEIPDSEDVLAELLSSYQDTVRINAAISLLKRKDSRCIPCLKELFIKDTRDIVFLPFYSIGRSMMYFKLIYSASVHKKEFPMYSPISLSIREYLLKLSLDLPEDDFLAIAKMILDNNQNDLLPLTMRLLENLRSEKAISMLQEYSQKLGAPYIRDYCHLSLYRLNQKGPYEKYIHHWVIKDNTSSLIELRPFVPRQFRIDSSYFELTPEESTRLYIEMLESLAQKQNERNILTILHALRNGHHKNRYVIAGLLLKAIE